MHNNYMDDAAYSSLCTYCDAPTDMHYAAGTTSLSPIPTPVEIDTIEKTSAASIREDEYILILADAMVSADSLILNVPIRQQE